VREYRSSTWFISRIPAACCLLAPKKQSKERRAARSRIISVEKARVCTTHHHSFEVEAFLFVAPATSPVLACREANEGMHDQIFEAVGIAQKSLRREFPERERMAKSMLKRYHIIDTAIASDNVGDEIIVEACRHALSPILKTAYVTTSSGHDGLGHMGRQLAASAQVVFLLGTNALAASRTKWRHHFIWHVAGRDMEALAGKIVLVGVGAHRAFDNVEPAQVRFLRKLLSPHYSHSVRDASALRILDRCGLSGINTACPTLWRGAKGIAKEKASSVCFSLSAHKAHPDLDRRMVEILCSNYRTVWFWPQQPRDTSYLKSLGLLDRISAFVPPNLAAYDDILASQDIDVIGTRLHGTIRGLMHGRRSLVIGIDHRAKDLASSTNLPVLSRDVLVDRLSDKINSVWDTTLTVDAAAIVEFLEQFEDCAQRCPVEASRNFIPSENFAKF
jgi:polysaccharide pyruvyl transferase WcaK-like protein